MQPRPESRIRELESQMTTQGARIRELADDTAEEFQALRLDIKQLESGMRASFVQIGDAFDLNANNIEEVKQSVSTIETRLDRIETTMETRFDKVETDITSIKSTQEQILQLLQQKSGE